MPKLPRVKAAEVIRALERLGFVQVRQRGSHFTKQEGRGKKEEEPTFKNVGLK